MNKDYRDSIINHIVEVIENIEGSSDICYDTELLTKELAVWGDFETMREIVITNEVVPLINACVGIIKAWHNIGNVEDVPDLIWDIYYTEAPEMKPIREFLQKYDCQ